MPHISKHAVEEKILRELEDHIDAILSKTNSRTRAVVFKEILTKTERLMIAKRLAMIYLIQKGTPTHTISAMLKVSPSTVARFENRVEQNNFNHTALWIKDYTPINKILKLIIELGSIPFEARRKSLGQLMREF